MRTPAIFSVLALAAVSNATVVWSNIDNKPADLMNTADGWTASRANDPDFVSYRCAADDFILTETTRLTKLTYYSVPISNPEILGGDWYIFNGDNPGGPPGEVFTGAFSQPLDRADTGWFNAAFGENVWSNSLSMDLVLGPGHYFIGFRTLQTFSNGGGKNGILTTRTAKGTARAQWNFEIMEDGSAFGPWVTMDVFNGVQDQEWAFEMEGEIVPEPATLAALGALLLGLRRKR
ncbi:MAG: PEP-CTERM sorting domain-containing protein [Fimbriimonadaceae bacterium]